jgi:protocatechuate 3,4-dioxygenase beta subunit
VVVADEGRPQDVGGPLAGGSPRGLDRRGVLAWFGGLGLAALLPGCAGDDDGSRDASATTTTAASETAASDTVVDCVLTPEVTEGPYYLDLDLVRSDITEDREGMSFDLSVLVVDADSCEPIKDAAVDVWHCDAGGEYSGVEGNGGTFLRGIQITDSDGSAQFRTIFPGWYTGRAVHIHLKVHLDGNEAFTGQLFFDDATLDAVYATEPYGARGEADRPNESDDIFAQTEGSTIVDVTLAGDSGSGSVTLGVQRT